jgi:hypothetical protein
MSLHRGELCRTCDAIARSVGMATSFHAYEAIRAWSSSGWHTAGKHGFCMQFNSSAAAVCLQTPDCCRVYTTAVHRQAQQQETQPAATPSAPMTPASLALLTVSAACACRQAAVQPPSVLPTTFPQTVHALGPAEPASAASSARTVSQELTAEAQSGHS